MTGNPNAMRQLDVDEAIVIARRQRDELLKACEVLGAFAGTAATTTTQNCNQKSIERHRQLEIYHGATSILASYIQTYSTIFMPTAISVFNLIKCLQITPEGDGRYRCAGRLSISPVSWMFR